MKNTKHNLSEWAIILYLKNNPGVSRIDMEKYFDVEGSRIGYVIKKLKDKNTIITKKNKNNGRQVKYFINKLSMSQLEPK